MDGNLPHFPTAQYRACLSWDIFFGSQHLRESPRSGFSKVFYSAHLSPRKFKRGTEKLRSLPPSTVPLFFVAAIIRQEKKSFPLFLQHLSRWISLFGTHFSEVLQGKLLVLGAQNWELASATLPLRPTVNLVGCCGCCCCCCCGWWRWWMTVKEVGGVCEKWRIL